MPVAYRIEGPRIETTFQGRVSFAELLDHVRDHVRDLRFRSGMAELIDATGAEAIEITYEQMVSLVDEEDLHIDRFQGIRLAIVAPSPAVYGVVRMYDMLSDRSGHMMEVFTTRDEAIRWLARATPGATP